MITMMLGGRCASACAGAAGPVCQGTGRLASRGLAMSVYQPSEYISTYIRLA